MSDKNGDGADAGGRGANRFFGSLKDALMAAARSDTPSGPGPGSSPVPMTPVRMEANVPAPVVNKALAVDAETVATPQKPLPQPGAPRLPDGAAEPQAAGNATRVIRGSDPRKAQGAAARTQLVRGRLDVPRGEFHQDPVVGWLVVVGGLGLGAYRPIFEGNNTIGRARSQRIAVDFGDETISSEEQAYIRYDSADRSFLFVPNLAKTNVVSVNNRKPTGAVALQPMDVITMGRTQLAFVPFCSGDFDWSELVDGK